MMSRKFLIWVCAPVIMFLPVAHAGSASKTSPLDYTLTGSGEVTLVFEAGFGTDGSVWAPVVGLLNSDSRRLVYSRAGLGGSPAPAEPMSIEDHLGDLNQLLCSLDIKNNVVLVGHSYGGLLAAEYAESHPDQVAALVLIDPATRAQRSIFRAVDAVRLEKDDEMMMAYMPDAMKPDYTQLVGQMDLASADIRPIAFDLPVVLFTSTYQYDEPFVFEETETGRALWLDMHSQLIGKSRDAVHIRMPDVGHNIHKDAADRVAAEIDALVDRLEE